MADMTIVNKKLMLAGLFLSKFGDEGLSALGFSTWKEAYNSLAFTIGGKPTSLKMYRQEYDPYFPNGRQGWHGREIRPTRLALMDEFGALQLDEFVQLVKTQFASNVDVDTAIGKADVRKKFATTRTVVLIKGDDLSTVSAFEEEALKFLPEEYEWVSCHGGESDVMAFSSREKAENWIESQIDAYVKDLNLDRESAVDGYEVALDGDQRSIKYRIVEREVLARIEKGVPPARPTALPKGCHLFSDGDSTYVTNLPLGAAREALSMYKRSKGGL